MNALAMQMPIGCGFDEGTLAQHLDWCVRYSNDYSNDQLDFLSKYCSEQKVMVDNEPVAGMLPMLIKNGRMRQLRKDASNSKDIPLEDLQIDRILYGEVIQDEFDYYGNKTVSFMDEKDAIIVIVTDENGISKGAKLDSEEFMSFKENDMENFISSIIFYWDNL